MISFEEKIHAPIIIDWWRKHPQLASTLIMSRGYKLPADWILDLNTNPTAYVTEDGKGLIEIYDTLVGAKMQEAKVFYFSPDFSLLKSLEIAACEMCFRQGISVIEFPKISVRYDKIKKDLYESAKDTIAAFQQKLIQDNKGDINNGNQDISRTSDSSVQSSTSGTAAASPTGEPKREGLHNSDLTSKANLYSTQSTDDSKSLRTTVPTVVPTRSTNEFIQTGETGEITGNNTASSNGSTSVYGRLRSKKSNPTGKGSSKKKSTKELTKESVKEPTKEPATSTS